MKLQTAGLPAAYDDLVVRWASEAAFAVGYWRGGDLIAVDCINRPGEFIASKQLITRRIKVDKAQSPDAAFPLQGFLK